MNTTTPPYDEFDSLTSAPPINVRRNKYIAQPSSTISTDQVQIDMKSPVAEIATLDTNNTVTTTPTTVTNIETPQPERKQKTTIKTNQKLTITLADARKEAQSIGFSRFWKMSKATLVPLLQKYRKTGVIPKEVRPHLPSGAKCRKGTDCKTTHCLKDVCVTSKVWKQKHKQDKDTKTKETKTKDTKTKDTRIVVQNEKKKTSKTIGNDEFVCELKCKRKSHRV